MLHCWANGDGTQRIEDTGSLNSKRMETVDEEFRDAAVAFIRRQHESDTPFFVWFNATHMHFRTHPKPESVGQAGRWQSTYHDTMIDHDKLVGSLVDLLDELGIAEDTIVMYSTDNGPHMNSWPDAGTTPFRSEKNSNWEGGYRVPCMVRWSGHIEPGWVSNDIVSHLDWLPTFLAAAGEPDVAAKLLSGHQAGAKTFKVHLDGHDLVPATSRCCASPASALRPALRLLLLHDDAEREFDYTAGAEAALDRARERGWTVISIRDDWTTVFAAP